MNKIRVIIVGERSQKICIALRKKNVEAFSNDIKPCYGGHPEWHLLGDCKLYLNQGWDIMIAHPPCTHLAVSGAKWFKDKEREQKKAIEFFMFLANYKSISRRAIENPICIMSTKYRKPDQIIQPWMFGHGETKATCLWLFGLPKLKPTNIVEGREERIWKMPPSENRATLRSETYQGIADAIASQWV